jgi:hypothetical protein
MKNQATSKNSSSISAEDPIRPTHYRAHPSQVECITIAQWFNFNLGNVIKYVWRSTEVDNPLVHLRKAKQYIEFEIARLEKLNVK